jgi:hypothetical protein
VAVRGEAELTTLSAGLLLMMMSFICSCRNKKEEQSSILHIPLEEGTYHKRLFRGPSTNDMKK